jgi:hypothetical protein
MQGRCSQLFASCGTLGSRQFGPLPELNRRAAPTARGGMASLCMVGACDRLCCVSHSCGGPFAPVCGKTAPPDRVQATHRIGCRLNCTTL